MPRGHVLVVDDEAAILGTLKKALTLEGYSVDVAGGVALAEERLRKGNYDLVLLDVALPDGDGVALLERIRTSGNDVAAIVMSGLADHGDKIIKLAHFLFEAETGTLAACAEAVGVKFDQKIRKVMAFSEEERARLVARKLRW